jgi:hypothetical protein
LGIPIHWCYLEKWGKKKSPYQNVAIFFPNKFLLFPKSLHTFSEKVKVEVVTKYSPIFLYWGHNLDVKKTIKKEVRDSDQGVIHSFIHSVSTTTATAAAAAPISRLPRLPCDSCVLHPSLFACVFFPKVLLLEVD